MSQQHLSWAVCRSDLRPPLQLGETPAGAPPHFHFKYLSGLRTSCFSPSFLLSQPLAPCSLRGEVGLDQACVSVCRCLSAQTVFFKPDSTCQVMRTSHGQGSQWERGVGAEDSGCFSRWEEDGLAANPELSSVTPGEGMAGKKLLLRLWGQGLNYGQGVGGKQSTSKCNGTFTATAALFLDCAGSPSLNFVQTIRMNCMASDFPAGLAP